MRINILGIVAASLFSAIVPAFHAEAPATKPAEVKLVLVTRSFEVTITRSGQQGVVEDNAVSYHAVSKKSGQSMTLKGSTWHTRAPDGSPARFLGYIFHDGNLTYQVLDEGRLKVIRGQNDVLIDESGKWQKAEEDQAA